MYQVLYEVVVECEFCHRTYALEGVECLEKTWACPRCHLENSVTKTTLETRHSATNCDKD